MAADSLTWVIVITLLIKQATVTTDYHSSSIQQSQEHVYLTINSYMMIHHVCHTTNSAAQYHSLVEQQCAPSATVLLMLQRVHLLSTQINNNKYHHPNVGRTYFAVKYFHQQTDQPKFSPHVTRII